MNKIARIQLSRTLANQYTPQRSSNKCQYLCGKIELISTLISLNAMRPGCLFPAKTRSERERGRSTLWIRIEGDHESGRNLVPRSIGSSWKLPYVTWITFID